MQRTHLGWKDAKNNVFCHRGDTCSESLGDGSVCRRMNGSIRLASSFSEVSLGIDMVVWVRVGMQVPREPRVPFKCSRGITSSRHSHLGLLRPQPPTQVEHE